MDTELLIWVVVFVGGYSAIVGWLLAVALRSKGGDGPVDAASGPRRSGEDAGGSRLPE